ncbi:MAG: TatD family hydrolase [Halanaerobiales bacterium]|nr:TatD family hydrolase [Halanaerobiales bacterium]
MVELIDSHAHLDFDKFNKDRDEVIERAKNNGIVKIINVGSDLSSSHRSLQLSQKYEMIYAVVGVHPHEAKHLDKDALKVLKDLSKADKVIGIGEIGLDFHYDNSPRDIQREAFRKQLRLAKEVNLPVVVHSREADEDTIKILKEEKMNNHNVLLHSYTGGKELAEKASEMGFYFGAGGIVTFNSASELKKIIQKIPLTRILIETDSPYLAPEPHRGKRNEPLYVKEVAKFVASLKNTNLESVAEITKENTELFFNI